jgi:hypothetical protein
VTTSFTDLATSVWKVHPVVVPVDEDPEQGSLRLGGPGGPIVTIGEVSEPWHDGYDFVDFKVSISDEGPGPGGLKRFSRELATDYRGLKGDRAWESIEHGLKLGAKRDSLGHVLLIFVLNKNPYPDAWQVRVTVQLEPGEEITHAAAAVERLLGRD